MAADNGRFDSLFARTDGRGAVRAGRIGDVFARTVGGRSIERFVKVRSGRVLTGEIDGDRGSFAGAIGKRVCPVVGDGRRLGDVAADAVKSGRRPFDLSSTCAVCASSLMLGFCPSSSMRSMSQSEWRRTIEGGRRVEGRRSEGVDLAV